MALQRVLEWETLNDADACAMDEIVALEFKLNEGLVGVQLPQT